MKLDATGQPEHPEDLERLAADDLVLCTIQTKQASSQETSDLLPRAAGTAR